MKYLKTFEAKKVIKSSVFDQSKQSVGQETDIKKICKKYDITNYSINSDGSIDVDGNVDLDKLELFRLPLKFRNVTENFNCSGGYFNCFNNKLTTLEGSPQTVGGGFYCNDNQLTTLEGSPQSIGGDFDCCENQLTTLEGGPQSVGGNFNCHDNQLTTLEGSPQSIGGDFDCRGNKLINFNGIPEDFEGSIYLSRNPVEEIYDLFDTIKCIKWLNEFDVIQGDKVILDRLEEVYHQLGMEIPEKIELHNYEII